MKTTRYQCLAQRRTPTLHIAISGALLWFATTTAAAVDWSAVKGADIVLFYPGQASWEWLLTATDHSGAKKFKDGKVCTSCHQGEQKDIGNLVVSGKKLEPSPIPGKPGTLALNIKAAHDKDNLYLRLEWTGARTPSGKILDTDYAAKVAVMFDDGHVPEAARGGCFSVCHDDTATMASATPASKMTLYLPASRTKLARSGGGENFKPQSELDQLLKDGTFMEYWQAKLNPGKPAVAADGYILAKRETNTTPLVKAQSEFSQGKWVVTFSRALAPKAPGRKVFIPNQRYTFGIAVHDDHTAQRFHHVSFATTLTLDEGDADIIARGTKP